MHNWDERYASGNYSLETPHQLLLKLAENLPPGKALDLACGAGRHANFLAEKGWDVKAVDNSAAGIEIAKQRAAGKGINVDFCFADLEKSEFIIKPDAYDLICDFYYLQREIFPKIKAGVKVGGTVVSVILIYAKGESHEGFRLKEGELLEYFADFEILHYHETSVTNKASGHHHRQTAEIIAKRLK